MKMSATLKSQVIVKQRKKAGLPVYNFGLGANPLPISEAFSKELEKHLDKKNYVSACGVDEFQNVIKKTYSNDKYKAAHVLTSNGLKEMLFLVQMAFKGLIIHITPSWISYKEQIHILNKSADLIELETKLEDNYKINLTELEKILSWIPKTTKKLMIFNNPNNPTGVVHTPEEVEEIAKVLDKYNVIVFSDEIYANLAYIPTVSISKYIPHLTIRGSSVSKDLGCGGYRLGWATFPDELTWLFAECHRLSSSIYSCTTVPIQYATANLLENDVDMNYICKNTKSIFSFIIRDICECIENSCCKDMIRYVPTQSAWYLFLNFDKYKDKLSKRGINTSGGLHEFLLNTYGIVTVAGKHFNIGGLNLRFSLVDLTKSENGELEIDFGKNMREGFRLLLDYFGNL
jgi:aspartate/methionine/tyrosine aminotransferase